MPFECHSDLFVEEALDLLKNIESPLMELERDPGNHDLINTIFRAMHTIKGSAGMFGFDEISGFTHNIENVFEKIRNGILVPSPEVIELTLASEDCIRELLFTDDPDKSKNKREQILFRLNEITGSTITSVPVSTSSMPVECSGTREMTAYNITFSPVRGILLRGVRISPLIGELDGLGQMSATADISNIPYLDEFDPEQCYLSWNIALLTKCSLQDVRSVFIFVEDYASINIDRINNLHGNEAPVIPQLNTGAKTSELRKAPILERRNSDSTSIRVKNSKLDTLVNLVGEMVTLHARLSQESSKAAIPEFVSIAEHLGRLTSDLREISMSVRMVPLAETFSSYNRLVRDLSKNLGKNICLEFEGGETELDKNVVEELHDPLMHIIRNSADHGIETPERRLEMGKDETGVIKLTAEHYGAYVRINVTDDGAGLDRREILKKGIERGILSEDADDRSIYAAIFEAGFSTTAEATDISGRGVGMDVVKKNLENLRGSVNITTTPGNGTTVSLLIPLTLAIIDGFMTDVCGRKYVFNLSIVKECVAYDGKGDIFNEQGMFSLRGSCIPFIDLRILFGIEGEPANSPQIVVTEIDGTELGFLVDFVEGHFQTVIKALGKGIKNAKSFSGATILGDGTIALIMDVNHILKMIKMKENVSDAKNVIGQNNNQKEVLL